MRQFPSITRSVLGLSFCVAFSFTSFAQKPSSSSSSSSSSGNTVQQEQQSSARVRAGRVDASGSAITLESSESLFQLAAALNACGYDADLANSNPVRAEVRADIAKAIAESPYAKISADNLCQYIHEHELADPGRSLAQYVSLALYLGPPPELAATADETDMPPDALQVVNILPLLRDFAAKTSLHTIWLKHHAEYEAINEQVHEPVTRMLLATNVYLKTPVSSYDGRRLIILVEPLLAPDKPNARIYSLDYVVVTSPNLTGQIKLDQVRHIYLHYETEPLVYAKAQSMSRLAPLLKPVQAAPLEFEYKTDVVALVAECIIKAIEARTMDVGLPIPQKPTQAKRSTDQARYDEEMGLYDKQSEVIRRKQVDLDMRQGWVLTDYFYGQLILQEHTSESLSEAMGEMVYGMDITREEHALRQIQFLPNGSNEYVTRVTALSTLQLAQKKIMQGDLDGAEVLTDKALKDPSQDHAEAMYMKSQVLLMQGNPRDSFDGFEDVLKTSKNPRTIAWAHVYLGRLYDIKQPVERDHAVRGV